MPQGFIQLPYMNESTKNRFVKEVESAAQGNPNIDMKLVREWQEITKMLEKVPPAPAPEPEAVEPPRLQPIPLRMFRRWHLEETTMPTDRDT